jgi:hypothetical protein
VRRPGDPAYSGPGGGEDEAADPLGTGSGELLGDRATEGHAEHVDPVVAEVVEELLDRPHDPTEPARPPVGARVPDARRVEADDLVPPGAHLVLEGRGQIQAGAEAGDEQEWRPLAADGGA